LDALGVEKTSWVGHDWGGWTGLLAALRAPERIARMLVLCVPHLWTPRHPRQLALLSYQGPVSMPGLGRQMAKRMVPTILQSGRGSDRLSESDVAQFADHLPPAVSVAMYRTFLSRELWPIVRGRYARAKLEVPTTVVIGAKDLVTRGLPTGPVDGQPQLGVERIDGVAHWIPEQRPDVVRDWVKRLGGAKS
ncbi:MAG: alpha/beta hydrolase, partial [Actinomycetota bacterium]|nr:alpha/beta hydrolase [Actinomycetota bacterium]